MATPETGNRAVSSPTTGSLEERLKLVLELTNNIVSNLDLKGLLQAITLHVRKVLHCRGVAVSLPDPKDNVLRLYALGIPGGSKLQEGHQISMCSTLEAFQTGQPVVTRRLDLASFVELKPGPFTHPPEEALRDVLAEAGRSFCDVPLIVRNRVLGVLTLGRDAEDAFSAGDVEFVMQAAGQVAIAIENALAYRKIEELNAKLAEEKVYLEEEIRAELDFEGIVGQSPGLREVLNLVETVAPADTTVLLLGETGTGKELIARAIHERSFRKDRTFVKLNCAAIPSGLLESELFGHERGAFTGAISQKIGRFELAHQGTLFLDEIGDIPLELQPKLLRALQEREFERLGSTQTKKVDVRVVAATHRNLERMIEDRQFRSDLFYRLNVFPIQIPPLRERPEDIPLLLRYFTQKYARRMQKEIDTIPAAALRKLMRWHWPGNVRELENLVERAVVLTRDSALAIAIPELTKRGAVSQKADDSTSERERILRILKETKGRVSGPDGAAFRMGLKRTTLISRMKKLGINPQRVF
jgi:formate hydrogenlyase transcriptional activator